MDGTNSSTQRDQSSQPAATTTALLHHVLFEKDNEDCSIRIMLTVVRLGPNKKPYVHLEREFYKADAFCWLPAGSGIYLPAQAWRELTTTTGLADIEEALKA